MNYIGKLESAFNLLKEAAVNHWELAFIFTAIMGVLMVFMAMRDPDKLDYYKNKSRIFRYCHDCPFIDMQTEVCSVQADDGEKCGLIDKTSGMTFDVTKQ